MDKKEKSKKGLIENISTCEYKPLTLKDWNDFIKRLKNTQPPEIKEQYSPWFLLELDDDLFIAMINSDIEVVGGMEGLNKMDERIAKLKSEGKIK